MLFTVKDVTRVVEIWRHKYAVLVIKIISDIFGDIDKSTLPDTDDPNELENKIILSDWSQLSDESLNFLLNTGDLEDFVSLSESLEDNEVSHDSIDNLIG